MLLTRIAIGLACVFAVITVVATNADEALARIVLTADDEDEDEGTCNVGDDGDEGAGDDERDDEDEGDDEEGEDEEDGDDEDDGEGRDCPPGTTTTTTPGSTTTTSPSTTTTVPTTTTTPTTTTRPPTELPPRTTTTERSLSPEGAPSGGEAGAGIRLTRRTVEVTRGGGLRLTIVCPAARSVPCRGVVSLERVEGSGSAKRAVAARRGRFLARQRFELAPGTSRGVRIGIPRGRVSADRTTRVRVRVATSNPGGAQTTNVREIRLRVARRGGPRR